MLRMWCSCIGSYTIIGDINKDGRASFNRVSELFMIFSKVDIILNLFVGTDIAILQLTTLLYHRLTCFVCCIKYNWKSIERSDEICNLFNTETMFFKLTRCDNVKLHRNHYGHVVICHSGFLMVSVIFKWF